MVNSKKDSEKLVSDSPAVKDGSSQPKGDSSSRRKPSQDRSKERMEKILTAAEACILEVGAANLKISDIAAASGMANASVYQYFSNREEIIQALLERYLDYFYELNTQLLSPIDSVEAFLLYLEDVVYGYHDYVKSNATYRAIWMDSQGWAELRAIDRKDNMRLAHAWVEKVSELVPDLKADKALNVFLTCIETGAHMTRVSVEIGGRVERIMMDEMIAMVSGHLKTFFISR
jgi:AcrR family transcriptional regulator